MAESEPAGSEPAASEHAGSEPVSAPPRRSTTRLAVLVGLTVVAIVLVVFGTLFGVHLMQANAEQARRDTVLHTASDAALKLTTLDYRTADSDVKQLVDGSTGDFAKQFRLASPDFLDVVKQTQLVSTGEITSAGIERIDDHSARVLVSVKSVVHYAGMPQGTPRNYRMGVELVQQGDRWLLSKVEFIL